MKIMELFWIFSVAISVLSLSVESADTKFEVVGSFEWTDDCDFPSYNIEWLKMDKMVGGMTSNFPCGEACVRNQECNYWVLNPTSRMCYLKKSPSIASVSSPGKTCGRIPTRISDRSWKMAKDGTHQFSKSCDFDGPEVEEIEQLEITGKARTALCGKACKTNSKCAYFALDKSSSTCYLKRSNGFALSKNKKDFACGFIHKRQQFKVELLTVQVPK